MADPFLSIAAFQADYKVLGAADQRVASRILQVTSDWIRDPARRPDIDDEDPAAQQVVFEVAREAIMYGKYRPLASFQNTTAHRTQAGTFNSGEVEKFVTDRHRQMLGLSTALEPAFHFPENDY